MFLRNYRRFFRPKPIVDQCCRHLNLLESQSKVLLSENGLTVQKFRLVNDAKKTNQELNNFSVKEYVIKAQILAGGRGKGHFDNGFKGGVHFTKDSKEVPSIIQKMLGHRLITKQTPKEGIVVTQVMVAESINIKRETYISILMDRQHDGPVIVASASGGTDIEDVAEKTPHLIKTIPIDIFKGITPSIAQQVADFLNFTGTTREKAMKEIESMWKLFLAVDAIQLEINPLAETDTGEVVCVDAKLQFDDNASFRQRAIFGLDDHEEKDPREVEAAKHNLNYVALDGNIACLGNGAGLGMATMDIVKLHGGEPANFLDVGGGVGEEQVRQAFKILTSGEGVQAVLVNVFGGIVNCATIANGIVNACKTIKLKVPLIIRLEGTNVDEARTILDNSGLPLLIATDLEDAAKKAVASLPKSHSETVASIR